MRPAPSGFTLVELVAVLAIFALVGVMAVQALNGGLRLRDQLTGVDARAAALARGLVLLRRDLAAMVPVVFLPPTGGQEPALLASGGQGRLALSRSGAGHLPGQAEAGLSRVIWELDRPSGVLSRRAWPLLAPRDPASEEPAVVIFEGIRNLELRTTRNGQDWQAGFVLGAEDAPTLLPQAVEIVLDSAAHGHLRILVAR